jgi:hypothetical protein
LSLFIFDMSLIPTARKDKLPKGFVYPLGAEAISAALEGIPQFDRAEITFSWRDEFWVSRWRKRLQARGVVTLLRVAYWEFAGPGRWRLDVYSVPSQYSALAREHFRIELLRVHREFLAISSASKSFQTAITFDLSAPKRGRFLVA